MFLPMFIYYTCYIVTLTYIYLGTGTEVGTFIGTDLILSVEPSIESHKIEWYHVSIPKPIHCEGVEE